MAAKFAPDQRVRIRADYPPGFLRTPYYCRGKIGIVERILPAALNPESNAGCRVVHVTPQ